MFKFTDFLEGLYMYLKNMYISKKAYRTCAIIMTGSMVVTVVSMDSKEFAGSGKNKVSISLQNQEETDCEDVVADAEMLYAESEMSEELGHHIQLSAKTFESVQLAISEACKTVSTNEAEKVNEITISENDYNALLRIVEAEAGNQDERGRMLVANVIMNRVNSELFPNNITEVIFQTYNGIYQFEPILNGYYYEVTVSDKTKEAVDKVLKGEDTSGGALYFTMKTPSNSWFNTELELMFVHGDHYFYR